MARYEYKVVPAPKKPGKIKGVKGTDNKFASALAALMNQYGADGWEYQRTDTLPCEERQGLTGRTTTFQNMLIFRRKIAEATADDVAEAPAAESTAEPGPVLDMPSFRSATAPAEGTTPALSAVAAVPEGKAPEIGSAAAKDTPRQPGIAAQ